ncbi:hypothetical protein GOBAR_AA25323 [Gossypium barbadense]|uniref:Uncharacterized protein n=1 Tax=Gossypium barbadense TaxID=3634 RepID=A0A2P5WW82_GOSBA|nr:hypothetical protein GOBAR_AA25323 [Gossypium barbadense]
MSTIIKQQNAEGKQNEEQNEHQSLQRTEQNEEQQNRETLDSQYANLEAIANRKASLPEAENTQIYGEKRNHDKFMYAISLTEKAVLEMLNLSS